MNVERVSLGYSKDMDNIVLRLENKRGEYISLDIPMIKLVQSKTSVVVYEEVDNGKAE